MHRVPLALGTDREGEGRGRGKSGSYFHGPDGTRVGRTRVAAKLGGMGAGSGEILCR